MSDQEGGCCGSKSKVTEEVPSCCAPKPGVPTRKAVTLADYRPLIVLISVTLLAAFAKQWHYGPGWQGMAWMHDFMGFFLVIFAMFKLIALGGFADGFQKYDLLAMRSRSYALLYPFLEMLLGLGYLSHWRPEIVYTATIVLLGFGAIGVFAALKKGLSLDCACMGSTLSVPLTTVALTEDLAMAGMAAAMLILR